MSWRKSLLNWMNLLDLLLWNAPCVSSMQLSIHDSILLYYSLRSFNTSDSSQIVAVVSCSIMFTCLFNFDYDSMLPKEFANLSNLEALATLAQRFVRFIFFLRGTYTSAENCIYWNIYIYIYILKYIVSISTCINWQRCKKESWIRSSEEPELPHALSWKPWHWQDRCGQDCWKLEFRYILEKQTCATFWILPKS